MIGPRIKLAREVCGITQAELADIIGTTQSGVASMEAGVYRPSPQFLKTIASTTGFAPSFFDRGEIPEFPYGTLLYRAQNSVKQGPKAKAHALCHIAFELGCMLASRLKRVSVNIPRLSEEASKCAQITRASFGLSPNSVIKDLTMCLERNGAWVFALPMEVEGFDGFSSWSGHDLGRPIIALMGGKTPYREVFTISEELGHLVMHSPLRVSVAEADDEARKFAQEFLLPAEAMEAEMHPPLTLSGLATLKKRWGVSMAFLAKRAASLSFISRNQHRYLVQEIRSKGWDKKEPGDENAIHEKPRMVRKMAEMLYGKPLDLTRLSKDSGLSPKLLRDTLGLEPSEARVLEFKKTS
jgi:Zn-dependent peptidase ImmA (M78 family)/transcriptional regulator with XRE-family HTH domain